MELAMDFHRLASMVKRPCLINICLSLLCKKCVQSVHTYFQNSKLTLWIAHDRYPWSIKSFNDLSGTLFAIRILLVFWKGYVCLYSSKLYFVKTNKNKLNSFGGLKINSSIQQLEKDLFLHNNLFLRLLL